jgi:hypothetical protein
VEGLRVVDASVMPTVPRQQHQCATIAIANSRDMISDGRARVGRPGDLTLAAAVKPPLRSPGYDVPV